MLEVESKRGQLVKKGQSFQKSQNNLMGVFSSELSEFGAKSALLDIFMRPYSSAEAKISQTRGQFWLWKIQIGP